MAHEDIAGYGGVDIVVATNWFIKKLVIDSLASLSKWCNQKRNFLASSLKIDLDSTCKFVNHPR